MKLFIYVTDVEEALKGDFNWSLTISSRDDFEDTVSSYVRVGEVDVDLDLDREALTKTAVDNLEEQITEVKAKTTAAITSLEARQQNLLALTND